MAMTRKKAIERALELSGHDERQALHWLYDEGRIAGRIAGLREAEKIAMVEVLVQGPVLRARADKLAKKARKNAK